MRVNVDPMHTLGVVVSISLVIALPSYLILSNMYQHYRYLQAAELGDARAAYSLGCLYSEGLGVESDATLAVQWWEDASKDGHAEACYELGNAHYTGHGVTGGVRNYEEAARLWRIAADGEGGALGRGLDKAQFMVGQFYEHGSGGLPVDFKTAMDYVSRAANQGKTRMKEFPGMLGEKKGVPAHLIFIFILDFCFYT